MRSDYKTSQRARDLRQHMTSAELVLWSRIRPRAWPLFRFRRQHPIGPYILDFYAHEHRLAVEVDGYTHSVGDQPTRDELRDDWLGRQGIRVLRLPAELVLSDMDAALATIQAAVNGDL